MVIILAPEITPLNITIREQVIGEARAYQTCSEYPEKIHKLIVKEKERKQNEKPNDIF